MKKKVNILFLLLMIIFIGIIGYSTYNIIVWKLDNDKGSNILKEIKNSIKIVKDLDTNDDIYEVDFDSLKDKNSDTVAFLKVESTNIEYPIVKAKDNDFYLDHSFDKSYNGAGWPFANYINKFDGSDKNITIFAHSRYDGSMFGTLYKTLDSDWQSNKNNYKILFITEDGTNYYEVISTYKILSEEYYINNSFNDDSEWYDFLKTISNRSNYDYGYVPMVSDKIITLSTCSSDDRYRIVLHAKLLDN